MGEQESQFAAALEEKKRTEAELAEKQRRIAELQKLAERGTPEQRTQALRKLHNLLHPKEKEK
ncbi:hypothetical protein HZB93_00355 [Candidatus Falkowbacteria bacterium]|nr:hypothetical protein [Candidatus Falkowbacteria bacterium]